MGQRTYILLEDDLDGSEAAETISFGVDGVVYEIDLSEKNATKLRKVLQGYADAGRRVGGRSKAGRAGGASSAGVDREQRSAMREWARTNGYEVGDRGRISAHVVEAYHAS
ncbi:MAG: histone-like nucleoid-structuring protein Lsr2 [Sporichthyaceae bacterium]